MRENQRKRGGEKKGKKREKKKGRRERKKFGGFFAIRFLLHLYDTT